MSVDNDSLRRLGESGFTALFDPVSADSMRRVVETGNLGKQLRRTYFAGFRTSSLTKAQLVRFHHRAIQSTPGRQPATALLEAWLSSVPQASAISEDLLGRDDPFTGPVTPSFYDRLEAVVGESTIEALKVLFPPSVSITEVAATTGRAETPGTPDSSTQHGIHEHAAEVIDTRANETTDIEVVSSSTAFEEVEVALKSFGTSAPTFDNVVVRDYWLWRNLAAPLLSAEDADALLPRMPDSQASLPPSGSQGVTYAQSVALTMEEHLRWPKAQAYWLAAASIAAQAQSSSETSTFRDYAARAIYAGARLAGMAADEEDADPSSLIDGCMRSSSSPVRNAVLKSLIYASTLHSSFYEDIDLPGSARAEIAKLLPELFSGFKKRLNEAKGSHEKLRLSTREYTKALADVRKLIDSIAGNPSIDHVLGQREKTLKNLAMVEPFALDHEHAVLSAVRQLLGPNLSAYSRASVDAGDDEFVSFVQSARAVLEQTQTAGSYLSVCVLAPLALSVAVAVTKHYHGTVRSQIPVLKVHVLKPVAPQGGVASLELEVVNEGAGAAEACTLRLEPELTESVVLDCETLELGKIATNQTLVRGCQLSWPIQADVVSLHYILEFRSRGGLERKQDVLKVARQPAIDWEQLEAMPSPYPVQSIDDPGRLKGRSEQLRSLRIGFQSSNSFMITGQKRVGKTSLVKVFLTEIGTLPDTLPLHVPIGELSIAADSDDLGRLGRDLIDRIAEEYEVRFDGPVGVEIPREEEFRDSFNATFSRFIRKFRRAHRNCRLAISLDDFDELPTPLFTGGTGRAFFLALRALIDDGTSFFFVGSERLPGIIQEQAERLNQVKPLAVDYLNHEALVALVREPSQPVLEWADEAIKNVETWSARNPYFATLICSRVWERALRSRDRWVIKRDVDSAVEHIAEESDRRSYQHFWSDSPFAREEERNLYETKSSLILLALSKLQTSPPQYVDTDLLCRSSEGLTISEARDHLEELIARGVLETDPDERSLVRFRVPLFSLWLKRGGASAVRQTQLAKGGPVPVVVRRNELAAEEVLAVSKGLQYRGNEITTDQVRAWAAQFGNLSDQRLMLTLLKGVKTNLFTLARFLTTLEDLHKLARRTAAERGYALELNDKGRLRNWYVTHADLSGKSGSATVKQYRVQNRIPEQWCGSPDKIVTAMVEADVDRAVVVCVDDFIGTGQSANDGVKSNILPLLDNRMPGWRDRILLIYATIVGYEKGIDFLEDQLGEALNVVCAHRLTENDKAFSPDADLFGSVEDRLRARVIAHRIGTVLEKKHPLGWEESEALVVFPDNVPNNTLPIFCKDGPTYRQQPWAALFPRS